MGKMNKLRQRLQSFDGSAKLSSDGRSMLLTSEDFEVLTCALAMVDGVDSKLSSDGRSMLLTSEDFEVLTCALAMVDGVDWELLRSQKEVLVGLLLNKSVPEELEGLVGLLDTIQDHVVECGEATELEVFGSETTSELGLKKVLNQIGLRLSGIDKSVLTTAEKQIVWILIAAGIVVFKEGTVTYLGDVNEG